MTAMERIKEIEEDNPRTIGEDVRFVFSADDVVFLIKACKVWREIAFRLGIKNRNKREQAAWEAIADEYFERRMADHV